MLSLLCKITSLMLNNQLLRFDFFLIKNFVFIFGIKFANNRPNRPQNYYCVLLRIK